MISEQCKKLFVKPNLPLKEALKQMDKITLQVLIVVDEEDRILGIITDGNIRRAIIKGLSFDAPISLMMTKNPIVINNSSDKKEALQLMRKHEIRHIPVIDDKNKVIGIYLWTDFLKKGEIRYSKKGNSVVIMAGGKGARLDPFTKILPKPLIPIEEKPIIEIIMDNFKRYGFDKFIISLNYKAEMIKMYFSENPNNYEISYIQEENFLGTIGALSLIKNKLDNTFIVSNCDVIIDVNFDTLLNYHRESKNQITVLGVIRHIKIPYGVLKMQNADLEEITEKPDYHFIVNSGIYILEPDIIDLIPRNKITDMPDLLLLAKKRGFKVQVYPANCSWFDIGEWGEYKKAIEYMDKHRE
jgi:dTDP-glucose pyrophosphorylase